MAQTANAITFKDAKIEYTTNGTSFVDMSGHASLIEESGGDRKTSEAYTYDGDTAIIGKGKREPRTVTATVIYTEETADPYLTLLPYFDAGSSVGFRWSPKGLITGTTGEYLYTTQFASSAFKSLSHPAGNPESGEVTVVKAVVITPAVTTSTTTS